MKTAVYFETWAARWTSDASSSDLAKLEVGIINLAFADPKSTYRKGQNTFDNTGLQFSWDFKVVKEAIKLAQDRGVKIMLSVGGASYKFDYYNAENIAALSSDLGCNGIDIDWEPENGDPQALCDIIVETKKYCQGLLSFAGWSTGCFSPQAGDPYRGMSIKAITTCYSQIDWINIMAYDAGKDFDVKKCYESYTKLFSKRLYLGFEVGAQGWGDALLKLEDVDAVCKYLKPGDGCFVWAYYKSGLPNCVQVINRFKNGQWQKIPNEPSKKFSFKCTCTQCGKSLEFNG